MKILQHLRYSDRINLSVKSVKTGKAGLFLFSFMLGLVTLLEYSMDIKALNIHALYPFLILSVLFTTAYFLNIKRKLTRYFVLFLLISILEVNFLYTPESFHVFVYWYCCIPLITLIIAGLRFSLITTAVTIALYAINSWHVYDLYPDNYPVNIDLTSTIWAGIVFFMVITLSSYLLYDKIIQAFLKIREKNIRLNDKSIIIKNQINKLENYNTHLVNISQDSDVFSGTREQAIPKILKCLKDTLQVYSVSFWEIDKKNRCMIKSHEITDEQNLPINKIKLNEYPEYMDLSLVHNVNNNIETNLSPFNALLPGKVNIYHKDYHLFLKSKIAGVIVFLNKGRDFTFGSEEDIFINSLVRFIQLTCKNNENRKLLTKLKKSNEEVVKKNNTIKSINEELMAVNEKLNFTVMEQEDIIDRRTNSIQEQNKVLSEYADINSHVTRAPLARIMGLTELLEKQPNHTENDLIIKSIIKSTKELDHIIQYINVALYEGKKLKKQSIEATL